MPKLLIYRELTPEQRQALVQQFPQVLIEFAEEEIEAWEKITDADAFYGHITPGIFAQARQLQWIQAPVAGLEHYLFPELIESPVIVTNMRGIYSDHIADHALGFLLCLAKGLHTFIRRQLRHQWENGSSVPAVHLADSTLGIIGLGGIGEEVARRGAVCGMKVLAVDPRRRDKPPYVEELWGADRLKDLLQLSDFVVICTPHTPETEHMINAQTLSWMKPSAFLINISRGIIVDLEALVEALQKGVIAGAGLDVFEQEPLPANHPLWDMENVILTPHVAWRAPHTGERRFQILVENLRRFLNKEPLINEVDKRKWF